MSPFKKADQEAEAPATPAISHHTLVELFQERNTLKRRLDEAEAERAVLRADVADLGKRAEEATRQLAGLEKMLMDPEKGQNAILYYRMRAVWDLCRNQLRNIAEELSGRQDQVERKRYTEAFEQQRATQVRDIQKLIEILDRDRQALAGDIASMEAQIPQLKRFWHKQRREKLMEDIDQAMVKFGPIDKRRMELVKKLEQVKKAPLPTYLGIGVPARRAINVAMIAMAQYLYLHFMEHDIAQLARSAGTKPVIEVNFGGANDCLKIGAQMWEVVMKLKADTLRAEKLKHRAEFLKQKLTYASDQDSVPELASLDYMLPFAPNAATLDDTFTKTLPVNVLRQNYWDLETLLLKTPGKADEPTAGNDVGFGSGHVD
ncbi:MAG TPA: hypothetical protein VLV87_01580 [Gammaproteobacteria bacterium]|nr:hypothetical protein [Gammaproteobacteria bacterium]